MSVGSIQVTVTENGSVYAAISDGTNLLNTPTAQTTHIDKRNPECVLKVTTEGVEFESKTDDDEVATYGMNTTGTKEYNETNKLDISENTFYGYVKDNAGNEGRCSATISKKNTNYTKTTKTCGRTRTSYNKTTKTCSKVNGTTTYDWSTTKKTTNTISCDANTFTCDSSHVGQTYTSCTKTGVRESWGFKSYSTVFSDDTCTPFTKTCNASLDGQYYELKCFDGGGGKKYQFQYKVCGKNYYDEYTKETKTCNSTTTNDSYPWTNTNTSNYVSSCSSHTFTCDSSHVGDVYTSCSSNYSYSFGTSSTVEASECTDNIISCNSSNYLDVYTKCTRDTSCDDGTELNDTYCYKIN